MWDAMTWFAILVVFEVLLATSFGDSHMNLECPSGYEEKYSYCYKKVFVTFSWEKAEEACEREGSELVMIADWHENDYVQKLLTAAPEGMYWTGLKRESNIYKWAGSSEEYNTYYGFWETSQPDTSTGSCVAGVVNGNWKLVPCQKMLPFICKTPAYPPGSFKCSKGPAISAMHRCDGTNDCEDGSDEIDCNIAPLCNWYSTTPVSSISIVYQRSKTCLYTLKANIGERIKATLSSLTTVEPNADSIRLYTGGLTLSESYELSTVKGSLWPGQTFVSGNHFMIIRMTSDNSREGQTITLSWTNVVPEISPAVQKKTAPQPFVQLSSPFYGSMSLPPDLAMVWEITAQTPGQVVTIMFVDVRLDSESSLEVFDRNMYDAVLSVRSVPNPAMYISYSRTIRIKLSTSAAMQSASSGFRLNYKDGCVNTVNPATSGTIMTPGFKTGAYPRGVTCTWEIFAPSQKKLSLRSASFNLYTDADYMKVYNATNVPVQTGNGFTGVQNNIFIRSDTGYLKIMFTSDKVRTEAGFELKYSIDCEPLMPSQWTMITETTDYLSFENSIIVTCQAEYSFMQEEYNPLTAVPMLCEAGGNWNVSRNPDCLITYCPIPPKVSNGWITTASGGVVVGGNVTYVCEEGFVLSSSATIKCKPDGTWEAEPSCSSTSCNTLPTVANGNVRNLTATQNQYGDVIEYYCNEGYETVGATFAYCQTNGTWSHDVPTCQALNCPLLPVRNADWWREEGVPFSTQGMLNCSSGFKWNVTSAQTISVTCLADGSFDGMEECVDIDECTDVSNSCAANEDCDNTIGSFRCYCKPGYFRNSTSSLCQDIKECSVNNGGCSHSCVEDVPGYSCTCQSGYDLFTELNQNNITLPERETGLRSGDEFYINHTCVRKTCDSLSHPSNGQRLTENPYTFYYEDVVSFACDRGYTMVGSKNLTCMANGQWSASPPTCTRASCTVAAHTTRMLNSSTAPGGMVYLSEWVKFECQYGSKVIERTMFCGYLGNEQYGWQGDDYSCPEIDCGTPESLTAAEYSSKSGNAWQDTFTFSCGSGFTVEGLSTNNNLIVTCQENGRWGFGNLTCSGALCADPGTTLDANQNAVSFEVGQEVSWTCTRNGFSSDPPTVILCEISGNSVVKWNSTTRPTCKDQQIPTITSCPTEAIYLEKSTAVSYAVPTASDNSLQLKYFDVEPANMAPGSVINQNTTIIYTAEDYFGNKATCEINVIVIEGSAPILSCPNTSVHYINTTAGYNIDPLVDVPGLVSSRLGVTASPATLKVDSNSLGMLQKVTVTATYRNVHSSSCSFLIATEASACIANSLPLVPYAGRSCVHGDDYHCIYTCTIMNGVQYVHSDTGLSVKRYNCTGANVWSPAFSLAPCVSPVNPEYNIIVNASFQLQNEASGCIDSFKVNHNTLYTAAAAKFTCPSTTATVQPAIVSQITGTNEISSYITIKLDTAAQENIKDICRQLIETYIKSSALSPFAPPFASSIICTTGTTGFTQNYAASGISSFGNACLQSGQVLQTIGTAQKCVPTLPGTYEANDISVNCSDGTYQDASGQTSCKQCADRTVPATTREKCLDECPPGFISDGGLPPCHPCPTDHYWGNSTHCVACPTNTSTVQKDGMTSESDCKAECPAGMFSSSGFLPCTSCPVNFYQELKGQKECMECATDARTTSSGSDNSTLCITSVSVLCPPSNTQCSGNGACSVKNHQKFCTCSEGYTGANCQTMYNYCSAKPCVSGTCLNLQGVGYNCTCPSGITGTNCERDTMNRCTQSTCKAGSCRNVNYGTDCLCPLSGEFTGTDCTRVTNLCSGTPCKNGGTCRAYLPVRKQCDCMPGYTGETCETNINECDLNPLGCMYNGTCMDQVNSYGCQCRSGFSQGRCQVPNDFCTTDPCSNAECYNDYDNYRSVCVCHDGFQLDNNGKCVLVTQCDQAGICNNGTCSNGKCFCVDGYTGAHCQHDRIDCTMDSCQNGGTCVDKLKGFDCMCLSGYGGATCSNIDDCVGQCTGPHVVTTGPKCMDKLNDFMCNCQPGWKGQNCTENIDECASYPCRHGANCTDGDNTYTCNCPLDFTMQDCSMAVNNCRTPICQNEGECFNMNGADTFCRCRGGTTDATCSTFPPVCANINPCTAHGQCTDEGGTAKCDCTTIDRTGSSCQLTTYHCGKEPCKNDGTCVTGSALDYTCTCKDGYSGNTCEQYNDPCSPSPCAQGATCMSDEDKYLCSCPGGAVPTDTQCKSTSSIGDILVDAEVDSSGTYLNNPFIFSNSDMLSVMLWVLCSNETYSNPTIFALEPRDIEHQGPGWMDSPPTEAYLLKINNAGVIFNNGTNSEMVEFEKNICDKNWHHISVTYQRNGTTYVKLDSSTKANDKHTVSGPIAKIHQVLLGRMFHGIISQVMIWNKILTLQDQLLAFATVADIPDVADIYQKWMNYKQTRGVTFTSSTAASNPVCYKSLEHASCVMEDKMPPTVKKCPKNVEMLPKPTERILNIPNLKSSYFEFQEYTETYNSVEDGESYLRGRYLIVAYAIDQKRNFAMCRFPLYIQYDDCPDPIFRGVLDKTCSVDSVSKTCGGSCTTNNEAISGSIPKRFHCTNLGVFNPAEPYLPFVLPPCSVIGTVTRQVAVDLTYDLIIACNLVNQPNLANELVVRLKASGVCGSDCTVSTNLRCHATSQKVLLLSFTLSGLQSFLVFTAGVRFTPFEAVTEVVSNTNALNFQDVDGGAVMRTSVDSINIVESLSCESGYQVIGIQCVQCNVGQYYDSDTKTCKWCPWNTYQDTAGQSSCKPCNGNDVTLFQGASNLGQCVDNCTAGNFFNETSTSCETCPKDFYQANFGKSYCNYCPIDKITTGTGSDSFTDCNDDCPVGYERSQSNQQCVKCPKGTFRIQLAEKCVPCKAGFTTENEATPDDSGCSIRICYNGTFRNASNLCEDCPYGYYQDEDFKDECKMCPGASSESTMAMGSNNISQCVFVCGAGQEVVAGERVCRPCNRSFFHTGDHPDIFDMCQACPTNKTTEVIGSTHMDNCTIAICAMGQEVNGSDCHDCPYNTFQEKDMPTSHQRCIACPTSQATENTKSTSAADCSFYCPMAGTYNQNGICMDCPRGSYRSVNDHSTTFSPCTNCTGGKTTEGVGNIHDFNCSIDICPKGQELNANGACTSCPYDKYQDIDVPTSLDKCKPCGSNEATVNMGSTAQTDCKFYCTQPGTENSDNNVCVACARGTYRSIDDRTKYFTACMNCTGGRTTEGTGSIGSSNCSIDMCDAGDVVTSSGTCTPCAVNQYQPVTYPNSAVTCKNCPSNKATISGGQASEASCVRVCSAGQQYNSVSDACEPCNKGTWNNGNDTMKFQQCASCPTNYTTVGGGNTDIGNCTLLDCAPGSYISGDNCLLCGLGSYQPARHQPNCMNCAANQNTSEMGSKLQSDCQIWCSPGLAGSTTCVKCPLDEIKSEAGLSNCVSCSVNFAAYTSNDARTACDVLFCDKGYKYDGSTSSPSCVACGLGTYKNARGRATTCATCPAGFTTHGEASTDMTDCDQHNCVIGRYYDATNQSCQPCAIGSFKNTVGNISCTACATGFTTSITGATSDAACIDVVCPAGEKRIAVTNTCEKCPIGQFQPTAGLESCMVCNPTTYTTQATGTVLAADCVPTCLPGSEYNVTSKMCDTCGLGTYKILNGNWHADRTTVINCTSCPTLKTTTAIGSTSASACSLDVCDVGTYQKDDACLPCDKGYYQDEKGQTQCKQCTGGKTTRVLSGSKTKEDCIPNCALGKGYNNTGSDCCCVDCLAGYFVDKSKSESCIRCPNGFTNLAPGSEECPYTTATPPVVRLTVTFTLRFRMTNFDCANTNSQSIYRNNLRSLIIVRLQTVTYNICSSSTCTNVQALTVTFATNGGCNQVGGTGRRKRAADADLALTVTVPSAPEPATSTTNSGVSRPIKDVINEMINTNPTSITPAGATLTGGSVTSTTPQCTTGQSLNNGVCEGCPMGTFESSGVCMNCPVNKYQDQPGQATCKECSAVSMIKIYTAGTNSTSVSQCLSTCEVNTNYCQNGGTCVADQTVYCQCGTRYSGTNCEIRSEPDNSTWIYIVAGTIGGLVFLLIIIIITVAFCRRPRSPKTKVVYEKQDASQSNRGYQSYPDNVGFPYQQPITQHTMAQGLPETYYLPYQQPYQQQPRAIANARYHGFEVDEDNNSGYRWTSFSEQ